MATMTYRLAALAAVLAIGSVAVAANGPGMAIIPSAKDGPGDASPRYLVRFAEPGALDFRGNSELARTAPAEGTRFDGHRAEVHAYRSHLAQQRAGRLAAISQHLGREVTAAYEYDILFHGIAIEGVDAAAAAKIAALPGVAAVEPLPDYALDTERGPVFIGADTLWSGLNAPAGAEGFRGEGLVIGVIDSGVNTTHPSFADDTDPSCGFGPARPKLTAKDCLGSSDCTGANPVDTNGHGSHVASTAAGSPHVAGGGVLAGRDITGVAPCAQIITYKVCPTNSCNGAAILAAQQVALLDQVDVVNFSISGGASPWTDTDRGWLDLVGAGIFVATTSGNTSATVTNPVGQVNHRGPWVMTTAYSSHDRISSNPVSIDGGPQDIHAMKSQAALAADVSAPLVDAHALGNGTGCTESGAFPAGSMTGRIALMVRGDCDFSVKIDNAIAAGAVAALVYNNNPGQPPFAMGNTAGQSIPSLMLFNADGEALRTFVAGAPDAVATIQAETVVGYDAQAGDILNAGSLRGPIGGGIEVTKPDLAAPGTNIFAAVNGSPTAYGYLSGSSMASPHVAGSALLIKGLQPTWSVPEIKSAIMLTAAPEGFKDFVNGTPNSGLWDADDVGSGRVELRRAARAGLVLHETRDAFLAAQGNVALQRALNLASMRNTDCTPSCSWTRTLRNTLPGRSQWTVDGASIAPGFDVTIEPASFQFRGTGVEAPDTLLASGFDLPAEPEQVTLTITATPTDDLSAAVAFGEVILTEASDRSPALRMTVAIKGTTAD